MRRWMIGLLLLLGVIGAGSYARGAHFSEISRTS